MLTLNQSYNASNTLRGHRPTTPSCQVIAAGLSDACTETSHAGVSLQESIFPSILCNPHQSAPHPQQSACTLVREEGLRKELALVFGPIPAFTWSDFGTPWKTEIRMAGPGIESGSSGMRVHCVTTAPPLSVVEVQLECNVHILNHVFRVILGAAMADRLACSPPTKGNRFQSLAGSLPDFRMRESCRTMQLVGGLSRLFLVSPALPFLRCSVVTSITLTALKTMMLRAAQGKRDPIENPPTSGIFRNDSRTRKSGSDPAGYIARFALVDGEHSNRSATAAPSVFGYKRGCWRSLRQSLVAATHYQLQHTPPPPPPQGSQILPSQGSPRQIPPNKDLDAGCEREMWEKRNVRIFDKFKDKHHSSQYTRVTTVCKLAAVIEEDFQ
ncbi:hypothetical protein PR048_009047 [Dryococelus australis]|uniref:Uncharacterized protein n=1 Tax=Dryococelus australis TaxID=614101 RepID=A0ABQ9HYT6_9NEOP|nr:hypothetical protein PR048_009047 [Dryococelus australis]